MSGDAYKRIWEQAALIPEGTVASYGQIAKLAGLPRRGARMVGRAVGAAPKEMQLPWHRIVNAQGKIAIPKGSRGYERQQELLRALSWAFCSCCWRVYCKISPRWNNLSVAWPGRCTGKGASR